jgi:hypothetical protein
MVHHAMHTSRTKQELSKKRHVLHLCEPPSVIGLTKPITEPDSGKLEDKE